ncbi:hypothetical protein PoB_007260700 [Plakobranchus ocellatus]|uniref:Uncharacterized protein n=1 Tax=Plakobranchus ocellatus TaxID=259542 RepID=A0AAV4DPR9_9GAST|nr:hypothetical protein PoB_007260700 [Plakobranchus ocellatus]
MFTLPVCRCVASCKIEAGKVNDREWKEEEEKEGEQKVLTGGEVFLLRLDCTLASPLGVKYPGFLARPGQYDIIKTWSHHETGPTVISSRKVILHFQSPRRVLLGLRHLKNHSKMQYSLYNLRDACRCQTPALRTCRRRRSRPNVTGDTSQASGKDGCSQHVTKSCGLERQEG